LKDLKKKTNLQTVINRTTNTIN